jgi:arylamine N-acetyltransferase
MAGDLFARYLKALGVRARRPGLPALSELTAAHLARIPFENLSKLYYRHDAAMRGLPDLARFLDGIERWHLGGTCYSSNFHFHQLLTHLGYQVALCGADMSAPDVHLVNVVTIEGRRYLVDVGYAAPLLQPLPLDLAGDREIAWGPCRYVLRPRDADGRSRLDLYRDGVLAHGYVVNPAARRIGEFANIIAESFTERATFMHALLIARFEDGRAATLRNLTLHTVEGSTWHVRQIPGPGHLPEIIEQEFGISRTVARQALDGIQLTGQP